MKKANQILGAIAWSKVSRLAPLFLVFVMFSMSATYAQSVEKAPKAQEVTTVDQAADADRVLSPQEKAAIALRAEENARILKEKKIQKLEKRLGYADDEIKANPACTADMLKLKSSLREQIKALRSPSVKSKTN